jgi:uncharacterized OB-fold protein
MSATPISASFTDGLARGELRYQACADCGTSQALGRYACRKCGSTRLEWRLSAGCGTVFATTVVARAPSDEFRALAPYTLVLVDLDEGARLMAHAEPGVVIGDRVEAGFFSHGGRTLVRFTPEKDS